MQRIVGSPSRHIHIDASVSFVDVRLFTPLDLRSKNVFHFTTRGTPHQKFASVGRGR